MWKVETADIWGTRYESTTFASQTALEKKTQLDAVVSFKLINAGMWRPFEGLVMTDVLFPHITHGFRGRNFHIITYHVRIYFYYKFFKSVKFSQNPPWQYIETNGTDIVGSAQGIVIDILNEMSKKLNFTYTLHSTSTSTETNTTDVLTNATVRKYLNFFS
jgi:glutamate receptor, ionotropic, invertebrate